MHLMQEVMAIAADASQAPFWLSVFSGNQRAIAFYQKCGFRIAGVRYFLVGADRQQDYLMRHEPASLP